MSTRSHSLIYTDHIRPLYSNSPLDPEEDDYFDYWSWRLDSSGPEKEQMRTVWTNIALTADDQLCQRTAFALSQIFTIAPSLLPKSNRGK